MKKNQYIFPETKNNRVTFFAKRPWFLAVVVCATFMAALLVAGSFIQASCHSFLCTLSRAYTTPEIEEYLATPTQLQAIFHYATTRVVPQQSRAEITLSYNVLQSLAPCNFLVFGLGHDSLMWSALNPRGKTLFLEEDPKWVITVLQKAPSLNVHVVNYPTRLHQADMLLASYKKEKDCLPPNIKLKGNKGCKLALSTLPDEVYEREWDVIMIDAPRGYFAAAPGRMGAIYTAAVMARGRRKPGTTHVYLHDVNRKVERVYAQEFLCKKHLVKGVGRLWHFEIPPMNGTEVAGSSFC